MLLLKLENMPCHDGKYEFSPMLASCSCQSVSSGLKKLFMFVYLLK
jgi:hypothetical protein